MWMEICLMLIRSTLLKGIQFLWNTKNSHCSVFPFSFTLGGIKKSSTFYLVCLCMGFPYVYKLTMPTLVCLSKRRESPTPVEVISHACFMKTSQTKGWGFFYPAQCSDKFIWHSACHFTQHILRWLKHLFAYIGQVSDTFNRTSSLVT